MGVHFFWMGLSVFSADLLQSAGWQCVRCMRVFLGVHETVSGWMGVYSGG